MAKANKSLMHKQHTDPQEKKKYTSTTRKSEKKTHIECPFSNCHRSFNSTNLLGPLDTETLLTQLTLYPCVSVASTLTVSLTRE